LSAIYIVRVSFDVRTELQLSRSSAAAS